MGHTKNIKNILMAPIYIVKSWVIVDIVLKNKKNEACSRKLET